MKILRQAERAKRLDCSRWTERRIAQSDPTYPQEIEVSPGVRGIPEGEFEAWLQSRPRRERPTADTLARVRREALKALAPPVAAPAPAELHDAHVREFERVKGKRTARGAK